MKGVIGYGILAGMFWVASPVWAQAPVWDSRSPGQQPGQQYDARPSQSPYPDQPMQPRDPVLQRRDFAPAGPGANPAAPAAQQVQAPFQLNPNEQRELEQVLAFWEKSSQKVARFESPVTRRKYDNQFGRPEDKLVSQDEGKVWFEAPDKAAFKIEKGPAEHWICTGKSIFVYDFKQKVINEFPLPPEMQGKGITEGPLPFIFGAKADQLKRRYYLRAKISPDKTEVLLEAHPRFFEDSRNFRMAEVILKLNQAGDALLPHAVQIHEPNPSRRTTFVFEEAAVNGGRGILKFLDNPFSPNRPGLDWRMEVVQDNPQPAPPPRSPQSPYPSSSLGARPGYSR